MLPFTVFRYAGYNYYLAGSLVIVEIIDPVFIAVGNYYEISDW